MRENNPSQLFRYAGWSAYASGAASIIGIVFLVIFFAFEAPRLTTQGETFGTLNDIAIIIQYLLTLPVTLALHRLVQARAPGVSRVAALIGIAGIFAIVVLQFLLVVKVLTFAEQIGLVTIAFLVIGAWLVITGYLGRSTGKLPHSLLVSILAATYLGYPIWAFWLGRLLLSGNLIVSGPSMKGDPA